MGTISVPSLICSPFNGVAVLQFLGLDGGLTETNFGKSPGGSGVMKFDWIAFTDWLGSLTRPLVGCGLPIWRLGIIHSQTPTFSVAVPVEQCKSPGKSASRMIRLLEKGWMEACTSIVALVDWTQDAFHSQLSSLVTTTFTTCARVVKLFWLFGEKDSYRHEPIETLIFTQ